VFHMLCRIKLFSNVHRTEIVLEMGRELTMGESSTKLDQQQQNFSGHILLSWSVVLQGRPARQNGGDQWRIRREGRDRRKWREGRGEQLIMSYYPVLNVI